MKAYSEKQKKNKKTPESLWHSHSRQVKEIKNIFILSGNNRAKTKNAAGLPPRLARLPPAFPRKKNPATARGLLQPGGGCR